MIIIQNNYNEEMRRLLIESGIEESVDNSTRADIMIEYTKMNRTSTFNLRPLVRHINALVDEFHKNTDLRVLNVRIEGVLINRKAENSQIITTVYLSDAEKDFGLFFKPCKLDFTIDYNHDGPVDVRDTVETAQFIDRISKIISPVTYGINASINDKEIDMEDILVIYLGGGLNYERIRKIYLALNRNFNKVSPSTFDRLYQRRHNTGLTLGMHCRRVLSALGYNTLDADRFFWTKDPDANDKPAEVEFYSLPRHTLKISDVNQMYEIMSKYIYPDPDTDYKMDVRGKLLLDAEPDSMYEWMKNPNFKIDNVEFLRDQIVETDKCSADDFFEELYKIRPGWRPKYN